MNTYALNESTFLTFVTSISRFVYEMMTIIMYYLGLYCSFSESEETFYTGCTCIEWRSEMIWCTNLTILTWFSCIFRAWETVSGCSLTVCCSVLKTPLLDEDDLDYCVKESVIIKWQNTTEYFEGKEQGVLWRL